VGLGFTIKSKNIDDNFLFHFTFLLICCNIHFLLIINSQLSLAFNLFLGTCHPTTKTLKSLNNNQSQKKKLKSPQQWRLPPLPKILQAPSNKQLQTTYKNG